MEVIIIGAGIGGLSTALFLHKHGIDCRVYEAVPEIKPLGAGISLLPHGTKELIDLGLLPDLQATAVEFKESCFFNGFGQLIYRDARPPQWPQFLVHRGDLQFLLLKAVHERLGHDRVVMQHQCYAVENVSGGVRAKFRDPVSGKNLEVIEGRCLIASDGIHSAVRKQFYPGETRPAFAGIMMWRGVTKGKPFLSGGSHVRAGSLRTGKMVIYPIRNNIDAAGNQLINWVAELHRDTFVLNDWNKAGKKEDFFQYFKDWHFPWLDVAKLIEDADLILEYPMVDRDPVAQWSFGRITLLGDAAHPMYPRGSNGAAQAIIDARVIAQQLAKQSDPEVAFKVYQEQRLGLTRDIVLTNRSTPPDILIETVHARTGDKPFSNLDDVISQDELRKLLESYKSVAGYRAKDLSPE